MADVQARAAYDVKVTDFLQNTPFRINFGDVPWSCDGTAQDMVAVMLPGEDKATKRKRIKDLVLFWHPNFFPAMAAYSPRKIGN